MIDVTTLAILPNEQAQPQKTELDKMMDALLAEGLESQLAQPVRSLLAQLQPINVEGLKPLSTYKEDHQLRAPNDIIGKAGQIPECQQCSGKCCDVKPGNENTIIIPKTEWAELNRQGAGTDQFMVHLKPLSISDRAVDLNPNLIHVACTNGIEGPGCQGCSSAPKTSANNYRQVPGAKPADCVFYPFFPNIKKDGKLEIHVASTEGETAKCPMSAFGKLLHLPFTVSHFLRMITTTEGLESAYVDSINGMHGYSLFDASFFKNISPIQLELILDTAVKYSIQQAESRLTGLSKEEKAPLMDRFRQALVEKRDQAKKLSTAYYYEVTHCFLTSKRALQQTMGTQLEPGTNVH